jgi:hypothetical protein
MKLEKSPMRKRFVVLIVLCFAYFIIGAICWWVGWLSKDAYLVGAGIVGSLASVLGLISLARPALTRTDIQNLEIESVQAIQEQSRKLELLESARSATQKEIGDLEIRKQEMELLVRKASLSLFLQEQRKLHERRVREELENNKTLKASLSELATIDTKLKALNEEIEKDQNVEQLREIIDAASQRKPTAEELFENMPFPYNALVLVGRAVAEVARKIALR